ncbi:MAG TPA: farnesyl diphosphate synthase [Rhodanobacteraceae bacterium]|nr:farnesyl diphosphate synthase [Rhodanobacteraceae bacterium]
MSVSTPVRESRLDETFENRVSDYRARIERLLDTHLPLAETEPQSLHQAMRYATLGGGKRMRPLLCYAAAETLGLPPEAVDDAACAVELIHAFSLIHDDLPAMDDDALRRGRPTTHVAFNVATAILAGDALQTLAFRVLASDVHTDAESRIAMVRALADATGSLGMTGGQAIDLQSEHRQLDLVQLEDMHRRKTGCLIRVCVKLACLAAPDVDAETCDALDRFASLVGLAFQIRDDLLDVQGDTAVIGKTQGADVAHGKSTFPALLGVQAARERCDALYTEALRTLDPLEDAAQPLRWMAGYIVHRDR